MKRIKICLGSGMLVSVLISAIVFAQATAQISGSVRDQTGAVLPGVEITATQTDTGISRNTITNETGSYVLPNLAVGPYRLEASLPGFRGFAQSGIVLQVNSNPVINVVLEIGQVSETVEVQANAALVETRSSGVAQVMENARILELPLNGRNVNDLITLSGGAVQTGTTGSKSFAGSPQVAVAGSLQFGTGYQLDGATHNSVFDGYSLPMPFPDALQEFKVETSGLSAQTSKGAAVGAVTKAGANEFHGGLFEFARNDLFNARSYFAPTKNTLKRHQMGGTLGGPIVQNKLFFFGGYQRTTLRQDPANVQRYVPTAAMLAGDFTAFTSAACNAGRPVNLSAPFVNNRVDPALYSKAALNITSKLPKPNDPCGLVIFGPRTNENAIQVVSKVDYQMSDNHSLFGRFMATTSKIPHAYDFDSSNALLTNFEGYDNIVHAYAFGDTYLINANTVNAFRLTVNRMATHRLGAEYFGPTDVGINAYSYLPKFLNLTVSGPGFVLGGGTRTDSTTRGTSYHLSDDVSVIKGAHQLAFGGNLAHGRSNSNSNSQSPGGYTFNGRATGLGMSDFLLGRLTTLSQGGPSQLYQKEWFAGLYMSDSWKATPNLTVNAGVRWEPYLPTVDTKGATFNFDYERFKQGIKTSVFKNAPAGFYYPGDPDFPGKSGVHKQWTNFSPRLGLAWDPNGDGRMSVRASYALSYEYYPLRFREDVTAASPWGKRNQLSSPAGGLDDPWRTVPGGSPFPFALNADTEFAPNGVYLSTRYDINNPYSSLWNLSVQREITTDTLLSASYIGTQTTHIWTTKLINPSIFFPGNAVNGVCTSPEGYIFNTTGTCSTNANLEARRKLTLERPADGRFIGALDEFDDGGTQSYHGLLASMQRRAARGLTINSNYTWSHCISDHYETDGPAPGSGYVNPNNRDFDRGNCESDRRHIFNFTAVAETPEFAGRTTRILASGWRLSGIYRVSSGAPLNILSGDDRALIGIGGQRASQVLASPYGDKSGRPLTNFLNRDAFVQPALGTLGNMGPLNVRGLRTWTFDMSLSRIFEVTEGQRLEFRAEAYNVTNSFRPVDPNTSVNNSQFGLIREARDSRIMQFALKYVF